MGARGDAAVPASQRLAGGLSVALGLGFGLGWAVALEHLLRTGELPLTPFGFRAFAGGPLDRLGAEAFVAAGCTLGLACAVDVAAGVLTWQGRPAGRRLLLATGPVGMAGAIGFALPFLAVGIPLRTALLLVGRGRGAAPHGD